MNSRMQMHVTPLSDGHYMVNMVTDEMINLMWKLISRPQRAEFETVYGKESAFEGFRCEIHEADHSAAFFCGTKITCLMWTTWCHHTGINEHARTLGCVCSDFALKHTINFVKHSAEVRDAFMMNEPPEVSEVYVFIADDFKSSKEWAVRVCGFKKVCMASANGGDFVCYVHRIGEGGKP